MTTVEWGAAYKRILVDAGVTGPVTDLADLLDQMTELLADAAHVNKAAVGWAVRDALSGNVLGMTRFGVIVSVDRVRFDTPSARVMERVRQIAEQAQAIVMKVVDH